MKKFYLISLLTQLFFSKAQQTSDAAVELTVAVQTNPAQIILGWKNAANTTSVVVYRKLKTTFNWGTPIASFNGTVLQYTDNAVSLGTSYEYRVVRQGTNYTGYGYINAGINVSEISNRGKIILLIDSTVVTTLSVEINRIKNDLEGDGWDVAQHNVHRNSSVTSVKFHVLSEYHLDSLNLKAVLILGHVPVPYSGNINPDGHPDHLGAWPADCYYADMDGNWTDTFLTTTTVSPARTQNIPGDGKFDQSTIPSNLELQIGRIDFANMPAFSQSEIQLLKNYLDKDHAYRKKIFQPIKRGVIDDNFGYFGSEAFAASAYKNFAPLLGVNNYSVADYFTSMTAGTYLWAYGCGGGSYNSAGGIGTTSNFATSNLQGVFSMLFGSYFGDWDSQDNFLRAPLAQGNILTNVWSGRPHYKFHHMALGENIGYDILLTQNNPANLYFESPTGITGRWIHNALMGDPTLRNDVVAPVSNVVATRINSDCKITWSASTETNIVGYNIYMRNDTNTVFTKINANPITSLSYTDNCLLYPGIYKYMVRTLKLEQTPSGTYYNMSEGIADTALNTNNIKSISNFSYSIDGNLVHFTNLNTYPANFTWDFGNGITSTLTSPTASYNSNSYYTIQLVASNNCANDTSYAMVQIMEVGILKSEPKSDLKVFPNPSTGKIYVVNSLNKNFNLKIFDLKGQLVFSKSAMKNLEEINLSFLNRGIYFIEMLTESLIERRKIILE